MKTVDKLIACRFISISIAAVAVSLLASGCGTPDSSKQPPSADVAAPTPPPAPTPSKPAPTPKPLPPARAETPPPPSRPAPATAVVHNTGPIVEKYKATDGRTISIGKNSEGNDGKNFKNPHFNRLWIADGFDFKGYDTFVIEPTQSTAKFHDDEAAPHDLAKENIVLELNRALTEKALFRRVVTNASGTRNRPRTLRMQNTIIQYAKGGGAARYWVGMYGGGQPVLVLQSKILDGDKIVCTFEAKRSGTSAGARLVGSAMKDTDIQLEDIRSLVVDLSDFMCAVSGKYQPM